MDDPVLIEGLPGVGHVLRTVAVYGPNASGKSTLLDALDIDRVHLGGSSMGGNIAVAMARRRPDRVASLWLLAPGGLREVPHSPLLAEVEAGRHNPLVIRHDRDFDRLMGYCYLHPPPLPGPVRRLYVRRSIARLDWQQRAFEALRHESAPLEDLARGLDIPTLVVWGEHDRVLNPDGLESLAELMPDCRAVRVADAGHLPMLEHPRREARRWLAFREGRDATGGGESI